MVGSTQSVVIGSLVGGLSALVSRFRRRPQPRHRRKNRVRGGTRPGCERDCYERVNTKGPYQRGCEDCNSDVPVSCGSGTGLRNYKEVGQPRGPFFHPIDDFVMDITAAAAVARQGSRVDLSGPNA
jgi:hypothetical protein